MFNFCQSRSKRKRSSDVDEEKFEGEKETFEEPQHENENTEGPRRSSRARRVVQPFTYEEKIDVDDGDNKHQKITKTDSKIQKPKKSVEANIKCASTEPPKKGK